MKPKVVIKKKTSTHAAVANKKIMKEKIFINENKNKYSYNCNAIDINVTVNEFIQDRNKYFFRI